MKYYLHDTNAFQDEKVTMLFIEFGFEAVGLFYVILEKLAMQEKPIVETVLKSQLNIKKKLQKQLDFMYKIGILSVRNGEVFNENLANFSEKYKVKKEKTRKRVSEWRENQPDAKTETCYKDVRNSPKVKESKVKVKEVKIIKDFSIDFLFYRNEFKEIWEKEFIDLKKTKKASITERTLNSQLKKIEKLSGGNYETALAILEKSVNSGWTDFYELKNIKTNTPKPKKYTIDESLQNDPNRLKF